MTERFAGLLISTTTRGRNDDKRNWQAVCTLADMAVDLLIDGAVPFAEFAVEFLLLASLLSLCEDVVL